jgi:hypothetical protein
MTGEPGKTPGRRIILAEALALKELELQIGVVHHSTYGDRIAAVPLSRGSLIASGIAGRFGARPLLLSLQLSRECSFHQG